jgi:hypothetical protein
MKIRSGSVATKMKRHHFLPSITRPCGCGCAERCTRAHDDPWAFASVTWT